MSAGLLELMTEEVRQYSELEEEDPAMRFIRNKVASLIQINDHHD